VSAASGELLLLSDRDAQQDPNPLVEAQGDREPLPQDWRGGQSGLRMGPEPRG